MSRHFHKTGWRSDRSSPFTRRFRHWVEIIPDPIFIAPFAPVLVIQGGGRCRWRPRNPKSFRLAYGGRIIRRLTRLARRWRFLGRRIVLRKGVYSHER